jgi:hypothetical protein
MMAWVRLSLNSSIISLNGAHCLLDKADLIQHNN